MINEKLTKLDRNQVAVESNLVFPPGCILCAEPEAQVYPIISTHASALGGSISSATQGFPLCKACAEQHFQRMGKLNLFMILSFLFGLSFAGLAIYLAEKVNIFELYVPTSIIAAVLIVGSFILQKLKGRSFKVKFELRPESLMSGKQVAV